MQNNTGIFSAISKKVLQHQITSDLKAKWNALVHNAELGAHDPCETKGANQAPRSQNYSLQKARGREGRCLPGYGAGWRCWAEPPGHEERRPHQQGAKPELVILPGGRQH